MSANKIPSRFINNFSGFVVSKGDRYVEKNCPMTGPHLHPQYEFFYNVEGCLGYFIDNKFFKLDNHDLCIVPVGVLHHGMRRADSILSTYIINFSDKIIEATNELVDAMTFAPKRPIDELSWLDSKKMIQNACYKIHLNEEQHLKYTKLLDRCIESEKNGNMLDVYLVFIRILKFLKPLYETTLKEICDDYEKVTLADQAISYINENFSDSNFSVSDIVNVLHVSQAYLLEKFKQDTGYTLKKFTNLRRFAEAQKLLYEGKDIDDIYKRVGFTNYSYFCKTFKREMGYSPLYFQKNINSNWMHV